MSLFQHYIEQVQSLNEGLFDKNPFKNRNIRNAVNTYTKNMVRGIDMVDKMETTLHPAKTPIGQQLEQTLKSLAVNGETDFDVLTKLFPNEDLRAFDGDIDQICQELGLTSQKINTRVAKVKALEAQKANDKRIGIMLSDVMENAGYTGSSALNKLSQLFPKEDIYAFESASGGVQYASLCRELKLTPEKIQQIAKKL